MLVPIDIFQNDEMGGACGMCGGEGKPERERLLCRPTCRWEDNTKMDLGYVDWVNLAADRDERRAVVDTAMNLRVSQYAVYVLTS